MSYANIDAIGMKVAYETKDSYLSENAFYTKVENILGRALTDDEMAFIFNQDHYTQISDQLTNINEYAQPVR